MATQVDIYTTPTCAFCKATKEFFKEHGVEYTEHDVSADEEAREEMIEISEQMGVPVTKVGDEIVVGFNKNKLAELLNLEVE